MKTAIAPHLATLLATRDTIAAEAAEADAHGLATAADLINQQADLEAQIEHLLPTQTWRKLFPHWVLDDVSRAHDASHPAPDCCRICAAATRHSALPQSV